MYLILPEKGIQNHHTTHAVPHHTFTHRATLYCAALRCAALRCAALRCAALRCAVLETNQLQLMLQCQDFLDYGIKYANS